MPLLQQLPRIFNYLLPGADFVWYTLDAIVSFSFLVLVFAAIYKVVPDVHIDWEDVWIPDS